MAEAVDRQSGDLDWVLALAAFVIAAVAWTMLWVGAPSGGKASSSAPIATLASSVSEVRRRASGTLVWEEISTGTDLAQGDAIFVPPTSGATVMFRDGTRVELDENTLVALEAPPDGQSGHTIRVAQGDVVGASGASGLSLIGQAGAATLESGSTARLAVKRGKSSRVQVLQGSARLDDGRRLPVSGAAEASGGPWQISAAWPVRLTAPSALARVYFHGAPPVVDLRWSGSGTGARVQVSRDPKFEEPMMLDLPAAPGAIGFTAPGAGRFHWRVVDGSGRPQSETRHLWILQDVPPVPLSPRDGETVAAYLGRKVPFAWSHVVGVRTYELEVADGPGFDKTVFRRSVDGTELRTDVDLPEGRYYWRVRSSSPERGESPWTHPRVLRLLRKPLPDAPELLDPELEVDP
jgi:FecR protein